MMMHMSQTQHSNATLCSMSTVIASQSDASGVNGVRGFLNVCLHGGDPMGHSLVVCQFVHVPYCFHLLGSRSD